MGDGVFGSSKPNLALPERLTSKLGWSRINADRIGPLEVTDRGREPVIPTGKQRALMAILLLHANEVVSSDRLIEELWGEQPPSSAAKSLQVHVSRLRRALPSTTQWLHHDASKSSPLVGPG